MVTIVELAPASQFITTDIADLGGELAWLSAADTPVAVGGGSVADGDDSSYMEIGAWYETAINSSHVEIVGCDFHLPSGLKPIALGMQFRASTPAGTLAAPPGGLRYWWNVYANAGDNSALTSMSYNSDAFGPIAMNTLAAPTTAETFWGDPLDRSDPSDPGNWCEVKPAADGGGEMGGAYEALTGPGMRVYMLIEHVGYDSAPPTGRVPWVNVHEARLVVACEAAGYFDPPYLRNIQRGDGLGFSSAPRAIQNNSVQGSLRNFGFN